MWGVRPTPLADIAYFWSYEFIKQLGNNNENTLLTYDNIANWYKNNENYDEALEYYKYVLDIQMIILGNSHLSIAVTHDNMGSIYNSQNNNDMALKHYQEALHIKLRKIGEKHPSTQETKEKLEACRNKKLDELKTVNWEIIAFCVLLVLVYLYVPTVTCSL